MELSGPLRAWTSPGGCEEIGLDRAWAGVDIGRRHSSESALLVTLLLEAREERQLGRLKSQLAKLDLLILDELGYVPASKAGAELLFDVISTAYERTSVVVTTNLPFEQWPEVLLSERLTGAALDRLTHRCQILETGAESYRLRDAKRRRRLPAEEAASAEAVIPRAIDSNSSGK